MAPRPPPPRTGQPPLAGSADDLSGAFADTPVMAPFSLGNYRVIDEIGAGSLATTYLARMEGPAGFSKWVVIKRFHPHLFEDDRIADLLLDSLRVAARIEHFNVAQIFDLGRDDSAYWCAMEYLHGEPLGDVMARAEERAFPISPELAARIGADIAVGLHVTHELRGRDAQLIGLVRGDLTPRSVFVTYEGHIKLIDSGIAGVIHRLAATRADLLKGRLAYMSPEQVRGHDLDRASDVFSLGVVLWELTTRRRLFQMDSDLDTLESVLACEVPLPSSIVEGYPPGLEDIVLRALAKRREERFQSARELSRALQNFLLRRDARVGERDVAEVMRQIFADRLRKRDAFLAWAATAI